MWSGRGRSPSHLRLLLTELLLLQFLLLHLLLVQLLLLKLLLLQLLVMLRLAPAGRSAMSNVIDLCVLGLLELLLIALGARPFACLTSRARGIVCR